MKILLSLIGLLLLTPATYAQEQARGETTRLSDDHREGRRLFHQRCSTCHLRRNGPPTDGPLLDSAVMEARGDAAIRERIVDGAPRMPGFRHTLDAAQIDRIIGFLKTIPPGSKPGGR